MPNNDAELPDCPHCGCNDVAPVSRGTFGGMPAVRLRCNFCGRRSTADEECPPVSAVLYEPIRCPHCESKRTRVASTRRKFGEPTVRYHRCADCERPFKSVEPG